MWAYYVLVFLPIAYYLYNVKVLRILTSKRAGKHVIVLFFTLFLLLLSLRHTSVGTDIPFYLTRFEQMTQFSFGELFVQFPNSEKGFLILIWGLAKCINTERVYLIIMAIIAILPVFYLYYKETENAILTLSIFLILPMFVLYFSGLRQSIAIALVVVSFYFTKKRKLVSFLITVLIASTIHFPTLIAILLYPLYHLIIPRAVVLLMLPIYLLIALFNKEIYSVVIECMGGKYITLYSSTSGTGAYSMLFLFILFGFFSYMFVDEGRIDSHTRGLRNILLLSIAIQCFAPVNSIAMRLNYYFLIFLPLLIPNIIKCGKRQYRQILLLAQSIMIVFFLLYFFYEGYTGADALNVFPYIPFWIEI